MEVSTILNNRYKILSQLGKGGMALVYKAADLSINRVVAIKMIRTDRKLTASALKRFDREAKFLAKLDHPNIVKLYDYGEEDGVPYLVMEYVEGDTLKKKMDKPINIIEAAKILAPVARGLAYAHDHSIIHRDIKPSNILITPDGTPKISDFGIAKLAESEMTMDLTGANVSVGTPEYMSPEQGLGKSIDGRTDVYSLGVVLYEMVTGIKPFTSDTPLGMLHQHVTEPVTRPSAKTRTFPSSMDPVILSALEKEPSNRYQSMHQFAEILERIGSGEKNIKISKSIPHKKNNVVLPIIIIGSLIVLILAWFLFFKDSSVQTIISTQTPFVTTSIPSITPATIPTPTIIVTADAVVSSAIELGGERSQFQSKKIDESNAELVAQNIEKQLMPITNIELSPNNRFLLASSVTTIKVLDSETLEDVGEFPIGKRITSFKISPDGKTIAVLTDDKSVLFWDVENNSQINTLGAVSEAVTSIAYSNANNLFAAGTEKGPIYIINLTSKAIIRTIEDHKQAVGIVKFSEDGTLIASGSSDHSLGLWEVSTGNLVFRKWDFTDTVSAVEISSDNQYLIAAPSDSQFILYTISDGKIVRYYVGHSNQVSAMGFSPSFDLIVTGSQDQKMRIWPVNSQYVIKKFENHLSKIIRIIFSADGTTIYSASQDGKINMYSIKE